MLKPPATWPRRKSIHLITALFVPISIFWIYFSSPHSALSDPLWAIHVSSSLLNSGDIYLDEYEALIEKTTDFGILPKTADSHLLPYFPYGNSLTILPIMWVIEKTEQQSGEETFYEYLQQTSPRDSYLLLLQRLTASIVTALAALVIYAVAYKQYGGLFVPVIAAIILGLGTNAYSIASRVLWQHGPSLLMLAVVLFIFVLAEKNPKFVPLAGFFLALSYIIRPTNSISILIFTILLLARYRKQLPGYLLSAMVVAIPFFWSNIVMFGSIFPPYYTPLRLVNSPHFGEALLGNLVSPSRGLFVFTPVLLFSIYGAYLKIKRSRFTVTDTAVIIILIMHWLAISSLKHWWGGYTFGPRFFTDMMPFMTFLLLPVIDQARTFLSHSRLHQSLIVLFGLSAVASIWIHYRGATDPGTSDWNKLPVSVDFHAPERLWDWSDPQFLRSVDEMPLVATPIDISIDDESLQRETAVSFTIRNHVDEDMYWTIRIPSSMHIIGKTDVEYGYLESGVPVILGQEPLSGGTSQRISLSIDTQSISSHDNSLGAIVLTTHNQAGEEKSVQVIPVSVIPGGKNWVEQFALSSTRWLPTDILVNGEKPESDLYAFYGTGWYLSESFDTYQWRWAQSPAEFYIYSGRTASVTLDLKPTSIFDNLEEDGLGNNGILQLTVNNHESEELFWQDQVLQVPIVLNKGWNVVIFDLKAGNFQPIQFNSASGDTRDLSFALAPINMNKP